MKCKNCKHENYYHRMLFLKLVNLTFCDYHKKICDCTEFKEESEMC